jgi:hypothetical protein
MLSCWASRNIMNIMEVQVKRNRFEKKMSEIMKEMASTVFKNPQAIPSAEAAHAALLFANVAWNRAVGENFADSECRTILRKFEKSRPTLWNEFNTRNWKALIAQLLEYKRQNYAADMRIIVVCGMRQPSVIHVEWRYPDELEPHV